MSLDDVPFFNEDCRDEGGRKRCQAKLFVRIDRFIEHFYISSLVILLLCLSNEVVGHDYNNSSCIYVDVSINGV